MTLRADGTLARFALESKRLTTTGAKPKLFEPNKGLELSVFDVGGLSFEEIRQLGIDVAKMHPTAERLYGWGEIDAAAVHETGLRIERDDDPPRHANIAGWPDEARKMHEKQVLLAQAAHRVQLDEPISVS